MDFPFEFAMAVNYIIELVQGEPTLYLGEPHLIYVVGLDMLKLFQNLNYAHETYWSVVSLLFFEVLSSSGVILNAGLESVGKYLPPQFLEELCRIHIISSLMFDRTCQ